MAPRGYEPREGHKETKNVAAEAQLLWPEHTVSRQPWSEGSVAWPVFIFLSLWPNKKNLRDLDPGSGLQSQPCGK